MFHRRQWIALPLSTPAYQLQVPNLFWTVRNWAQIKSRYIKYSNNKSHFQPKKQRLLFKKSLIFWNVNYPLRYLFWKGKRDVTCVYFTKVFLEGGQSCLHLIVTDASAGSLPPTQSCALQPQVAEHVDCTALGDAIHRVVMTLFGRYDHFWQT